MQITFIQKENFGAFQEMIPKNEPGDKWMQSHITMFGAVEEDCACGVLVVGWETSVAQLLWLYVAPEYRNRGTAQRLVDCMIQIMQEQKVTEFLAIYPSNESGHCLDRIMYKNEFAISAFQSNNFQLTFREIIQLPYFKRAMGVKISSKYQFLSLKDTASFLLREKELLTYYDLQAYEEYSVVCVRDKTLCGVLLIRQMVENEYDVGILRSYENDPKILIGLLCTFGKKMAKDVWQQTLSPDAVLTFQVQEKKAVPGRKRVFARKPKESVWFHHAAKKI